METIPDPNPPAAPSALRRWFDQAMEQPGATRREWIFAQIADPDERARVLRLVKAAESDGALDAPAATRVRQMAAAFEHPAEDLLGQRFSGFRLVRVVGRGGMATVFLGERDGADFDQRAAVKLLRRGLFSELEQRLFQRERRLLAQLSHPNIARLIDGGVMPSGIPFLVLEYVDGEPITLHAATRSLDLKARLDLMLEVCRAVAAAHRALIVHRDLKPANILIDTEGQVKLLDFGIAKLLSEAEVENETRATARGLLTPEYAAPEQFEGNAVTMATDVYALGVILHELVHDELPASTDRARSSTSSSPHAGPVTDELALRRRVARRGDLDKVMRKALAASPQDRYPDAAAFADDLDNFLASRPVRAHPPSGWYRARKFVRRHRGGVLLSLLLLAGMIGSLVFALWQAGVAREQARIAQAQASRAEEVQGFIEGLFSSLHEGQAPISEVRVLDLVERATTRIESAYPENPEVRASLLALFARIQSALGNYERNRMLAAAAVQANVEVHGALDPRSLDAAVVHGHVLRRLGEYDAALAEFGDWRDRLRAGGVRGFELARVLDAISMIRMEQGISGDEAIALKREVLDEHERDPSLTREARATGYNNLGAAYQYAGDFAGALGWYGKARELNRSFRPGSRAHAVSLLNVGMVLGYAGRWREARGMLLQAVEVFERIALSKHPSLATAWSHLCQIHAELDQFEAARRACDRAVAMSTEVHGSAHVGTIFALTRRAVAAYAEGRFEDGDADLADASRAKDGSDSDPVYNDLMILGIQARGLRLRDRAAELRDVLLRLHELSSRRSRRGPLPGDLMFEAQLVWACARVPAPGCAGHDTARVQQLLADTRFASSAQRLAARVVLAESALFERRPAEAIALLEGVDEAFGEMLGPNHSQFGGAHLVLARALEVSGDAASSRLHRARAQAIADALPVTHPLRRALAMSGG